MTGIPSRKRRCPGRCLAASTFAMLAAAHFPFCLRRKSKTHSNHIRRPRWLARQTDLCRRSRSQTGLPLGVRSTLVARRVVRIAEVNYHLHFFLCKFLCSRATHQSLWKVNSGTRVPCKTIEALRSCSICFQGCSAQSTYERHFSACLKADVSRP